MSRRSWFRASVAFTTGLLLLAGSQLAAVAHKIPIDGTTLAGPAVVWVRASVKTEVVVLEHQREITIHLRRYVLDMGSGSGVVVNQNGTVVTAANAVGIDLERARVHAINKAFGAVHKVAIRDPFKRQRLRDPNLNAKLRACYGGGHHRECIVTSQTQNVEVLPWAQPPFRKALAGQVVSVSDATKGVAVLQIDGPTNMPSVAMAPAGDVPEELTILGFSGPPTARVSPEKTAVNQAHLRKLKLPAGSGGRPVVDHRGRMVGLVDTAGGTGGQGRFHPIAEVTAALKAARIEPQRGLVDSTFEEAIRYYNSHHDLHAVGRFEAVLKLYQNHVLARRLLDDARQHAGSPEDRSREMNEHGMPAAAASGPSLVPFIVAAGILALLAVAGVLFWRRRHQGATGPGGTAPMPAAVAAPSSEPTPPRAGETESVAQPGSAETRTTAAPLATARTAAASPPGPRTGTRVAAPASPASERAGNGHDTGRRPGAEVEPTPVKAGRSTTDRAAETRMPASAPTTGEFAFCTQCGKPRSPDHQYCGYCGNRIG